MADRSNLFRNLTRLFRSGPIIKRKVRQIDTRTAKLDTSNGGSSILLLSKTQQASNGNFGAMTAAPGQERMARLQDYNEMDCTAEINAALDIYADESVAQDANGKSLHIYSDNPAIKKELEELFYNTLNAEFNLRPWVRNLAKYGDFYLFIDVSPTYGVINVVPIPINEIVREEGFDSADPLAVRYRWNSAGNKVLQNWEVAHFRLLGNDMFLPYGSSMLEGARKTWRQLVLIEDAMLVYRVTRSPERRVFYVDVGGIPPDEIANYMEAAKSNIKSSQVIDRSTGRLDSRYNPLSIEEDYWIPTRGADTATKIDTLPSGQNTGHVEDVEYMKKKLISALKVPAAYLGYNDAIPGASGLSQIDIRFSRTINMVQRMIVSELNKIAMVHLFAAGFRGDDLVDFELSLSNPSTIAQQQKLELIRSRFEIAGTSPEGLMSERWIHRNVIGLNDQEILQVKRERLDDVRAKQALEAAQALAGVSGEESSETGGGAAEEEAAPAEGETSGPGLETAADTNVGQGDLITSTDLPRVREGESPVKLAPHLKTALANRRRNLRRRTHGMVASNDRAVNGDTAKPTVPENNLRSAFSELLSESDDIAEKDDLNETPMRVTVRPIFGQIELRALGELAFSHKMKNIANTDWEEESTQGRMGVLLERVNSHLGNDEEHEDVREFELYVVPDEDTKEATS